MNEQTTRDNQTLLAFWDSFYTIPEEEKNEIRQTEDANWEELAPSEKLLRAVCALGGKKHVLDYGCGNGWAAIAAAKSGCASVTAADPAPNAVEAVRFLADFLDAADRVHPVCGGLDWLKTVPDGSFDALICSNVLDVVPPETAGEILGELARIAAPEAEAVVGFNYWISPQLAAEKGLTLTDGRLYEDGVLRMVSRSDEEWAAIFAPFFTVESLDHYAWPGESVERRRLFRLRRRQSG